MEAERLRHFHALLSAERAALDALAEVRAQAAGTVSLDQTASGRVTRMDAMQQQAMAQAELERAVLRGRALDAALARVADGTYGECPDCGGSIDERRLEAEPCAVLCITCASARETR